MSIFALSISRSVAGLIAIKLIASNPYLDIAELEMRATDVIKSKMRIFANKLIGIS